MKMNHKYLLKLMSKVGKGKAKIYLNIIYRIGNHSNWQPLDRKKLAKDSKVSLKKVNKAIRRLKKANIIRYQAGYVRYTPQLLTKKGVLKNKVQSKKATRKKHKHQRMKSRIKSLFSLHKKHK